MSHDEVPQQNNPYSAGKGRAFEGTVAPDQSGSSPGAEATQGFYSGKLSSKSV